MGVGLISWNDLWKSADLKNSIKCKWPLNEPNETKTDAALMIYCKNIVPAKFISTLISKHLSDLTRSLWGT